LSFDVRTAFNYIKLFNNRELLTSETVSELTEAYRLLSSSEPESDVFNVKLARADQKRANYPTASLGFSRFLRYTLNAGTKKEYALPVIMLS
jgi:hypothetical protein